MFADGQWVEEGTAKKPKAKRGQDENESQGQG